MREADLCCASLTLLPSAAINSFHLHLCLVQNAEEENHLLDAKTEIVSPLKSRDYVSTRIGKALLNRVFDRN